MAAQQVLRLVVIVVFGLVCAVALSSSTSTSSGLAWGQQSATATPQSSLEMTVEVLDVNTADDTVLTNLTVFIRLPDPYNKSSITVVLTGYLAGIRVECYPDANFPPMTYRGQADHVTWGIFGYGELFPFDSYNMTFWLQQIDIPSYLVNNLSCSVNAHFTGPKIAILRESWQTRTSGGNDLPCLAVDNSKLVITLARQSEAYAWWIIPPILLAGLLLGASAQLDARNRASDRLLIYTSILLFGFSFYAIIRDTLPYRSSFTIPEFLIMNMSVEALLLCTATAAAPSAQAHVHGQLVEGVYYSDLVAIVFSSLFFSYGYLRFFSPIMRGVQPAITLTLWTYQIGTLFVFALVSWMKVKRLLGVMNQDET